MLMLHHCFKIIFNIKSEYDIVNEFISAFNYFRCYFNHLKYPLFNIEIIFLDIGDYRSRSIAYFELKIHYSYITYKEKQIVKMFLKVVLLIFWLNKSIAQEPCEIINVISDLIVKGIVNVIYLMDYNCDSCYYEAEYLPSLQSDMLSRGIVINPVIGVNSEPEQVSTLVPGISVDTGRIWSALGQHNGHVFIVDRCNRLAYEVIMPWSQFKHPFVKAAILSTYHSQPCGACPTTPVGSFLQEKEILDINTDGKGIVEYPAIKKKPSLDKVLITEDDNTIPMRIIYTQQHIHHGDPKIYKYIEILAGDPSYHYHPEDENEDFFLTKQHSGREKDNPSSRGRDELESNNDYYNHSELSSENSNNKNGVMNKEKLWSHYFKILFWLPHV